ncbi:PREDICTED: cell adhesion molecule 3-like [Papilio xuthus]|uniref:Cell adhesion molecule 3-like n=1 Tax=Papilio xuthus TaxID=66420 RepID=A0AAJ7EFC4_PAPXU|nr:PREDICTED: cell adhesion molecule 3-like [Papilio xuthus]
MTISRYTLVLYTFLLIFDCMLSLKLLELRVPSHVKLGSQPELACHWELGPQDLLYSIKWYKDGQEFFRHVPRDLEPHRKYYLPGVAVNKSDELASHITLYPATLETAGRYRCEVSGEKPLFPTVSEHANMIVVVLPEDGPVISGFNPYYRIGDQLRVNCSSVRSRPAVRLTWYVNGEPAPFTAITSPKVYKDPEGYETTSLALSFQINEQHFVNGGFKIKCLATLASVYWKSNEESARELKTVSQMRIEEKSYNPMKTIELEPNDILKNICKKD